MALALQKKQFLNEMLIILMEFVYLCGNGEKK